ncbi:glycosyl hydrolase [Raphidocelis subcapitata]|uniref:mannan endo-1,4-beta-mannosidase n=1 Tax=Raphidocelis subcapitata TaxID=307507 RepID=A0A2V0P033_9CHLO|nr:glycosyl hydrolase [Raphidocelis subcapitata]|eukprot:GBF91203.1 glycosyl hydrolase [Raphidocelis subcapitata]
MPPPRRRGCRLAALLALALALPPARAAEDAPGDSFHAARAQAVLPRYGNRTRWHIAIGARDRVPPADPRAPPPAPPPPPPGLGGGCGAGVAHALNAPALRLCGRRHHLAGIDLRGAAAVAASGPAGRLMVLRILDEAQALGLNSVRAWAFDAGCDLTAPGVGASDSGGSEGGGGGGIDGGEGGGGGAARNATPNEARRREGGAAPPLRVQPAPGVLDERWLSEGLDWLISQAAARGMRTLLVLTGGADAARYCGWVGASLAAANAGPTAGGGGAAGGGGGGDAGGGRGGGGGEGSASQGDGMHMLAPELGAGGLTVGDFYSSNTVKSVFLDFVAALLSRVNTASGAEYRYDPALIGWQLAAEPDDPGNPGSDRLRSWLRQVSAYIRQRAPNQIIVSGLDGTFGPSTPHHQGRNAQVPPPASPLAGAPAGLPFDAVCTGSDFFLHSSPWEVDVAALRLDPAAALACGDGCMLDWARRWFAAHLQDAVRLQKPLLVGVGGAAAAPGLRARLLSQLQAQVDSAAAAGHPVAGWFVDAPAGPWEGAAPGGGCGGGAAAAAFWQRDAFLQCLRESRDAATDAAGSVGGTRADSPAGWAPLEASAVRAAAGAAAAAAAAGGRDAEAGPDGEGPEL